jgi:hypothetical protein
MALAAGLTKQQLWFWQLDDDHLQSKMLLSSINIWVPYTSLL